MLQTGKVDKLRPDAGAIEVIIGKIEPLEMDKPEEAAGRVDGAVETAATEIKCDYTT